jgi:hypothetical protein
MRLFAIAIDTFLTCTECFLILGNILYFSIILKHSDSVGIDKIFLVDIFSHYNQSIKYS